jgi:hypothetical protein
MLLPLLLWEAAGSGSGVSVVCVLVEGHACVLTHILRG